LAAAGVEITRTALVKRRCRRIRDLLPDGRLPSLRAESEAPDCTRRRR
jgi:hypothetical protein